LSAKRPDGAGQDEYHDRHDARYGLDAIPACNALMPILPGDPDGAMPINPGGRLARAGDHFQ
jgi:hypothetical protein